jgi:molybdopterin/thiamine biosynthesis adenylyltransferase
MNLERIQPTIDTERLGCSEVVIVGGAYGLAKDLVRCGLKRLTLMDFDRVDLSNPARQDLDSADIGRLKIEATRDAIHRINSEAEVNCLARDFCDLSREEVDSVLRKSSLLICATDHFAAQARGNQEALRLGIGTIWIGMYKEGRAGEIVYWVPKRTPACYRCICSSRYAAFTAQARDGNNATRISSAGGTIPDLHLVDAIAAQIAIGILTDGANNRMGRLIRQLDNRNLLQVKLDPLYRIGDKDIFGEQLGPAHFAFNTIALQMSADPDCPDCAQFRRAKEDRCAA